MKLSDGIYLIEGENHGRYPFCNCIFIKNGRCLLDSGAGESISSLNPEVIINSHWHEDHIPKNCIAKRVLAHELDANAIENFEEFKRRYGIGDFVKIFVNFEFCKVSETFGDGDILEFGVDIETIHTPGHSLGHCCFLIDGEILYLGDIDLTSFGPWYGCLDCNVDDFVTSIRKVRKIVEKGVEIAVPSHGPAVFGKEKILSSLDRYLEKIFEREERIKELGFKNSDFRKLGFEESLVGRGIIYKKLPEPKEVYGHFEKVMIEKHLERLGHR